MPPNPFMPRLRVAPTRVKFLERASDIDDKTGTNVRLETHHSGVAGTTDPSLQSVAPSVPLTSRIFNKTTGRPRETSTSRHFYHTLLDAVYYVINPQTPGCGVIYST